MRKTQGKGTTSRRVESADIWTCLEADYLKKKMPQVHRRRLVINIGGAKIWGKFIFRPDSETLKNFDNKFLLSSKISHDLFFYPTTTFLNILPLLQIISLTVFVRVLFYFFLG